MSAALRQALLARFLVDEAFEARVREAPAVVARDEGVDEAFMRRVAGIDEARVRSFRRSRRVKAARRGQ